jgi:hypothetical protein
MRDGSPHDPAHSAAWHVGPDVSDLASVAVPIGISSNRVGRARVQQPRRNVWRQKNGVLNEHPFNLAEELPLLCGLLLRALGSLLRHVAILLRS